MSRARGTAPPPSPAAAVIAALKAPADVPAAMAASRFAAAKTEAFFALSWARPPLTAAIVGAAIALYIATTAYGYALPAIGAHAAVAALAVAAAVAVHNALNPGVAVRQLTVPFDRDAIVHLSRVLADAAIACLERANALLSWADAAASARALAYALLIARFVPALVAPGALLLAVLVVAAAAPAYARTQAAVDGAWDAHVAPALRTAEAAVSCAVAWAAGSRDRGALVADWSGRVSARHAAILVERWVRAVRARPRACVCAEELRHCEQRVWALLPVLRCCRCRWCSGVAPPGGCPTATRHPTHPRTPHRRDSLSRTSSASRPRTPFPSPLDVRAWPRSLPGSAGAAGRAA